jgi:FkbM family methyltransferase
MKRIIRTALGRVRVQLHRLIPRRNPAFAEQRRLLERNPPKVIFDVGAHHGESVSLYKKLFPAASVYCFEPFSESFAVLKRNIQRLSNVKPFNLALSDQVGEADFNANAYSATNSLLATSPHAEEVWPGGPVDTKRQVRVQTSTLDNFCREQSIDAIDLLKLDVQGAEPLVLKGGAELLRRGRVRLIYTEIITLPTYSGQAELHEFLAMMRGYGFELFNLFNLSTTPAGQLRQVDAIFLPAKST